MLAYKGNNGVIVLHPFITKIAKRLGHCSARVTWNIYSHLYPDKDLALAKGLEKILISKEDIRNELLGYY